MELNKLIEQFGKSKNSPSLSFSFMSMIGHLNEEGGSIWIDFVEFILASRPTCGVEQRKFLDEVEKGKLLSNYRGDGVIDIKHTTIEQRDFEARLEKVIKGM
jgi:hypothetical protein